jgi:cell division protein FtsZ
VEAATQAISSQLLEDVSIEGAKGVLINVKGGPNMTLHEINAASALVHEAADEDAHIIFGAVVDETMGDYLKVTVIATGFDRAEAKTSRNLRELPGGKELHDIPTVIRNRWDQDRIAKVRPPEPMEHLAADEYDIPAFLRKRADS